RVTGIDSYIAHRHRYASLRFESSGTLPPIPANSGILTRCDSFAQEIGKTTQKARNEATKGTKDSLFCAFCGPLCAFCGLFPLWLGKARPRRKCIGSRRRRRRWLTVITGPRRSRF